MSTKTGFEQQNRSFFSRVREGYLAIAAREPQRVVQWMLAGRPHRRIGRLWRSSGES
jgi:hypothetical protein